MYTGMFDRQFTPLLAVLAVCATDWDLYLVMAKAQQIEQIFEARCAWGRQGRLAELGDPESFTRERLAHIAIQAGEDDGVLARAQAQADPRHWLLERIIAREYPSRHLASYLRFLQALERRRRAATITRNARGEIVQLRLRERRASRERREAELNHCSGEEIRARYQALNLAARENASADEDDLAIDALVRIILDNEFPIHALEAEMTEVSCHAQAAVPLPAAS